ncbi:MAG: IS21 family transposase [Comamonadaceae bacterium]|nr:IS21 family transposase [Comamonadaceae bacterium]
MEATLVEPALIARRKELTFSAFAAKHDCQALLAHRARQWPPLVAPRVSGSCGKNSGGHRCTARSIRHKHPYSGQQIYQRLREVGFDGGITIVKDYVQRIRPRPVQAFLKLSFLPGEAAQVDWGEYGTITVGATKRRLSFFCLVLCFSRRMYLEFTVSQTSEFFLACHERAFAAFGGVPQRLIIDNLKSAVLQRLAGVAPVFNGRYLDFSRHWGFEISACNVRSGNEKGRVENGVGYVKKNFLAGLELADFSALNPAATLWLDTVANVRLHESTHQRPIEMFEQERGALKPLNPNGFDLARIITVRANKQFRVALEANHYSVPARYAGRSLLLKAYDDRVIILLCFWHQRRQHFETG